MNIQLSSASVPAPVADIHGDGRWMSIHEKFLHEAKSHEPDVLFLGDSLVERFQFTELWSKMFEPLHCLNFGIGGDQTQHLLWRIEHGELKNLSPKIVVVLVGTNNVDHSSEEVAEGILTIVKKTRERLPSSHIIVMGIPPRGQYPNRQREKLSIVNSLLKESLRHTRCRTLSGGGGDFKRRSGEIKENETKGAAGDMKLTRGATVSGGSVLGALSAVRIEDTSNITFFDTDWALFIHQVESTISPSDLYDFLHFTEKGYAKLFEPLLELVQELLQSAALNQSVGISSRSSASRAGATAASSMLLTEEQES